MSRNYWEYSSVYLDGTGKWLRDNAYNDLASAIASLESCRELLSSQVGIGTEFVIPKLDDIISTLRNKQRSLSNL